MKKLNITKEAFEKSKYFTKKYGKLEYVSESGKLFKTNKGNVLKFKESKFKGGIANDEEYTFLRVSVAWDIKDVEDSTLPKSVFIKVPRDVYDGDVGLNLSGMIEDYFGYPVDDILPTEADNRDKKLVKDWLLWTADEGLVDDDGVGMKYDESPKKSAELTEDAILDAIPVDARDGLVDINEPDGSFGRYTWYVKFAPFSEDEAKVAADGITKSTGRRTTVASTGREVFVLVMDYPSRVFESTPHKHGIKNMKRINESKKLVKEGAGAGYTVKIKDLKFGKILDKKYIEQEKKYESYHECKVEILPGEYEIEAEDYYNDFFWQEHEFGETPKAKIDGGIATIAYSCNSYDEDEADDELHRELENQEMDIAFDYGWGWVHADLPKDKPIVSDHVDVEGREFYGSIDKIELNAPDLADAVNGGHQSIYDRDEEDDAEDEEPINESFGDEDGWRVFDYGGAFPYTERYTVLDPDGYSFFIGHNGGVGSFPEDAIEGSSEEVCDALEIEIKDKMYKPRELAEREILDNPVVQKGLKRIKVKFQYEKED